MALSARFSLALLVLLAPFAGGLRAQLTGLERPGPLTPARPETKKELDRREAVKLYGLAVAHEHNHRYLEAVRSYEQAARLDPEAAAPLRALVPLYLALDRLDEALTACKKALDLDPDDHETWHLYARQLRAQNRLKEATEAFARALACPGLKEHPARKVEYALDLATLHEARQEYDRAEAAYREAAAVLDHPAALLEHGDISPEEVATRAADTYERLGSVCVKAGRPDRALAYFVKARDKVKGHDPARARRLAYNLAEVEMARGRWREALASLDEYLETEPQGTEAYRAKIKALQQLGRGHEVLPALKAYADRDRHNVALKLLLAEQYAAAGEASAAEDLYRQLANQSPTPEVYRGLFKLFADGPPPRFDKLLTLLNENLGRAAGDDDGPGDADAAARARAMLIVLREDSKLVQGLMPVVQQELGTGRLNPQTTYFLGVLAARTRQLGAAEQLFRNYLAQPAGRRGLPNEHDVYANLLRVLRMAHKHEAVVEVCRQGRERSRLTSPVLFHTEAAQALARLGRFDEAIAEANKGVEVAPDTSRLFARRTRALVLSRAGQHEQAIAEGLAMLKDYTDPEEVRGTRHLLSLVYSAAKEHAKSEEQLRLILAADPNDATANNDLGYNWADLGKNLEEAERLIRKAIDLDRKQRASAARVDPDSDRDNAAYVDSLGWVLFRRGDLKGARAELEKAVALPDGAEDPVVWDHLGDVCYRQGDRERAAAAWRKAIELYDVVRERPADERYREIKQKLKLLERDFQR